MNLPRLQVIPNSSIGGNSRGEEKKIETKKSWRSKKRSEKKKTKDYDQFNASSEGWEGSEGMKPEVART